MSFIKIDNFTNDNIEDIADLLHVKIKILHIENEGRGKHLKRDNVFGKGDQEFNLLWCNDVDPLKRNQHANMFRPLYTGDQENVSKGVTNYVFFLLTQG